MKSLALTLAASAASVFLVSGHAAVAQSQGAGNPYVPLYPNAQSMPAGRQYTPPATRYNTPSPSFARPVPQGEVAAPQDAQSVNTRAYQQPLYPTASYTPPKPEDSLDRPLPDHRGIFTFQFENDIVAGSDNNYTNGVRFSFLSAENHIPEWINSAANHLPTFDGTGHRRWGLAFGQSMYTPDDTTLRVPNPDDQPYAGFLYGSATLIEDRGTTLDTYQLTLGIVGPSSLGEETQDFIHSAIGSPKANGWDFQLKDEPALLISYERKWRGLYEFSPWGLGVDVTPSAGFNLGNVFTDAGVGAVFRFGQDLPADYGPPLIRPSLSGADFFVPQSDFGWYIFAGLEGRAVARNIFLDGNTWKDSPSVDKHIFVGGLQGGVAFTINDYRIAYTHVLRTDQFEGQSDPETFGALSVSYRF